MGAPSAVGLAPVYLTRTVEEVTFAGLGGEPLGGIPERRRIHEGQGSREG